jgi:hypothetical protein
MNSISNGSAKHDVATSDTILASWLWTQGFRPARVAGGTPRRIFIFADVPEHVVAAFHRDTAAVSPMQFGQAYKALLRLLHQ